LCFHDIYIKTITKTKKKIKMAKKVLRYTEEEFVTLLENIVKKVKQEETLNESRNRKKDLNNKFRNLR